MEKSEAEFMAKLLETFKVEAEEHLQSLTSLFLSLEQTADPDQQREMISSAYREVHNLKGAARAVNLTDIQTICQPLEDVLSAWKSSKITVLRGEFDVLYATIDLIGKLFREGQEPIDFKQIESHIDKLKNIKEGVPYQPIQKTEPRLPAEPSKAVAAEPITEKKLPEERKESIKPPTAKAPTPSVETGAKTIRISTRKLDKLLQQVEEMLIVKQLLWQRLHDQNQVLDYLKQWEKRLTSSQRQKKKLDQQLKGLSVDTKNIENLRSNFSNFFTEQTETFKILRDLSNKLMVKLEQDHRLVRSMVDTLLEDTKNLLTQPFFTLLESFPRMVRDISTSLKKEARIQMHGVEIEIDRRILEEMKDPLIHIIRNSIDHGIEPSEERAKINKPPFGLINVTISQISGNSVEITVSDDGRGINIERVKEVAIKQSLIDRKDADSLSEEAALKLILQPGFSTALKVTELSGRGLGLNIVVEKVEKLGGQVLIETKLGEGTVFRLRLPLTMATFRGIHIQTAEEEFIIPTSYVKRVAKLPRTSIETIENRETVTIDGKTLPFVPLKDVLKIIPKEHQKEEYEDLYILVLKIGEIMIGFSVDKILNEQEVFVKNLGKFLIHVRHIGAATIDESGKVIPILDPADLIHSAIRRDSLSSATLTPVPEIKEVGMPTILVVEDSITARTLLKNILEFAGYYVLTAVDGLEAYNLLKTKKFDLVLSDIEMPRMDGFELTAKIRSTEDLKDLPVVLCTSRGSKQDRERGVEVGASAYLDKGTFAQAELLEIIDKLL